MLLGSSAQTPLNPGNPPIQGPQGASPPPQGPSGAHPDDGEVVTEKRLKLKKPSMYAVVLLNDDYTPMEFVVWLVQAVFSKTPDEATRLMLDIHNNGRGVCGIFTRDVAQTKAKQVEAVAQRHEHPLACVVEACGT